MEIPHELSNAIERELAGIPPAELGRAVERLSARYRERSTGVAGRFLTADEDVSAYLAFRMPATFGAVEGAMLSTASRIGFWSPTSVLDVGAGTGAASWAATVVWPEIESVTLVDQDARMLEVGRRLASRSSHAALRSARWLCGTLEDLDDADGFDLVVSAYVLNEIDEADRDRFVDALWARTRHTLILIDAGTPRGFAGIRRARAQLIRSGAHMVAPCPHCRECPMPPNDWCHFAARVNRSRLHRMVKAAEKSYEDEKFSYIAVSREPVEPAQSRVIRHPQFHKGYVELTLCAQSGLRKVTYSRRKAGVRFRAARSARWGDEWDDPEV